MNKFSDFIKDDKNAEIKINQKEQQDISNLMDKYSKLSGEELMEEFVKESAKKKENGELSADNIDKIKTVLTPYLNDEQVDKLNNLLNMVK